MVEELALASISKPSPALGFETGASAPSSTSGAKRLESQLSGSRA
jgi:hypothetical protein